MFVYKHPDWIGQIIFNDSSYAVFDGVKDMMKYYLNMKKYTRKEPGDIVAIYVTDYYNLKFIDARKAFYIQGSDVLGPMGKELIPFERESDAKVFMRDHKGKKLLTFNEITPEMLRLLEE